MTENLNFLYSVFPSIPLGEFVVARVKPFTDITKLIPQDQIEEVFWGKYDNASLLVGFGLARQVAKESGNALLIFNPKQEITFSNNIDYGQGKVD